MVDSALVSRLCREQRECWQHGQRVPVESYLSRQNILQDDPDGLLDLICNEILLSEEAGDRPSLADHSRTGIGTAMRVDTAADGSTACPSGEFAKEGSAKQPIASSHPDARANLYDRGPLK